DDGDVLAVVRRHLRLDVVDDLVDLRLVDPGALDAHRLRLAHRVEQGVALADELLRAGRVEDDAGVLQGGGREGEPAGHVRLDDAGDDVDRRALRGEDQVDPRGTGELGDALDRGLDVAGGDHHEVRELVDDHQQVRVGGQAPLAAGGDLHLPGAHGLVEVVDVLEPEGGEVVVAGVHRLDYPLERLGGLLRVGDDRGDQVRDALVDGELHALGI